MTFPARLKFGTFMAPFHWLGENPTLALDRDLELIQWLDHLGYDEAWIGEHHSAGWEIIASPEIFIATAAERTRHIKLGTGVMSLPYHHPMMAADRMVLLDHLTRGRVMLGVGPGALGTDAFMLGIDPHTQRPRTDEAVGIIKRLLTETEPITYQADWFSLNEAVLNLRPYTLPHFPIVAAAAQSPSGMVLAGKHGLGVLSVSVIRDEGIAPDLKKFWSIAEETAAQHGNSMNREDWRMSIHVFLADTKKEAMEQARVSAGRYQHDYFENTLGLSSVKGIPPEKIVDALVEKGAWCIGTPDEAISFIKELDEKSGGFGGVLIQAVDWGTREQVLHSYELIARYVMPHFQGSLVNQTVSANWSAAKKDDLMALRTRAIDKAKQDYAQRR